VTRDVYGGDEDLPAAAQSEFMAVLRIEARVKLCSSEEADLLRRKVAQLTIVREVTLSSAPE
jgi:hypothetical protein